MKALTGTSGHIPDSRVANKAELAEFFCVTLPAVEAWVRKGCPYLRKGSKGIGWEFDLLDVARWKFAPDDYGQDFDPDQLAPRERKDWYDSEKKRRDLQVQDGELYIASDYDMAFSKILKTVAMGLETLPDVLERSAGIGHQQIKSVINVVDDLREKLYRSIKDDIV